MCQQLPDAVLEQVTARVVWEVVMGGSGQELGKIRGGLGQAGQDLDNSGALSLTYLIGLL